jgi:hypothetical protein
MSRLGTGSDQATILKLIRQAHEVVVAVMWMSLRYDSDKTTQRWCIPGAQSLRTVARNVNPPPIQPRLNPAAREFGRSHRFTRSELQKPAAQRGAESYSNGWPYRSWEATSANGLRSFLPRPIAAVG